MIHIIYGTKNDYVKNKCHIFLNRKKGVIKQKFDYKTDSEFSILNDINQTNLFDNPDTNKNKFYCITNCSFLTSKTNKTHSFLNNLLLSTKNVICLIVVKNEKSFDSSVLKNKSIELIKATTITDTQKLELVNELTQINYVKFDCETTKSMFISKLNNDPHFIENEIKKIANYANGEEITKSDLNVLFINGTNENVFNLLIYILTSQKENAYKLFASLMKQKIQIINILQTISAQLFQLKLQKMLLLKYKNNYAFKSISEIGISSYVIKLNWNILNTLSLDKIDQILEKISLLDYNIKNNIVIPSIAFQLFISEI